MDNTLRQALLDNHDSLAKNFDLVQVGSMFNEVLAGYLPDFTDEQLLAVTEAITRLFVTASELPEYSAFSAEELCDKFSVATTAAMTLRVGGKPVYTEDELDELAASVMQRYLESIFGDSPLAGALADVFGLGNCNEKVPDAADGPEVAED